MPSRVAGYDLASAIALLGMVFVNFRYLMNTDDYGSFWLLWLGRQNLSDCRVQKIFLIAVQITVISEVAVQLLELLLNFCDSILSTSPVVILFYHALDTSPFSSSDLFATYWVNHFGQGPLEKILRWIST